MAVQSSSALVDAVASKTGRALDLLYASLVHSFGWTGPFFSKGWGDLGVINFQEDLQTLRSWPPSHFDQQVAWKKLETGSIRGIQYEKLQATFRTPCIGTVYDALPPESRVARVQMLLPVASPQLRSCVIHLAGTGDHGFERRLRLHFPLLSQGVGCMVLESPYYGARRPHYQRGSKLWHVSDLLALGRATIEESLFLLNLLEMQGVSSLGVSGFSMGGVHASMVAALFPGPVACSPLLAPRSAAIAYCQGALRSATAWQPLTKTEDQKQRDIREACRTAAQAFKLIQRGVLLQASSLRQMDDVLQQMQAHMSSDDIINTLAEASERNELFERDGSGDKSRGLDVGDVDMLKGMGGGAGSRQGGLPGVGGVPLRRLWGGLGFAANVLQSKASDVNWRQQALLALQQVLDAYTDVTRYPRPQRPDAAVLVGATEDAYVSPQSVIDLHKYWEGSEVRWVPGVTCPPSCYTSSSSDRQSGTPCSASDTQFSHHVACFGWDFL